MPPWTAIATPLGVAGFLNSLLSHSLTEGDQPSIGSDTARNQQTWPLRRTMTLGDAALALMEMREDAPQGESGIQAVLFGIRHAGQTTRWAVAEISRTAHGSPDTCGNGINLGKGLAKYLPERGTEGEC